MSACIICKSEKSAPWGAENGYTAVRCGDCDLVYLSPWPDLSQRFAAVKYGEHPGEKVMRDTSRRRLGAGRQYVHILRRIYGREVVGRKVEWIDVGCGYGEFLEALRKVTDPSSDLRGTEPNMIKREAAAKRGFAVDFTELKDLPRTFTHASLLNVFSHLPDPIDFLKDVKARLREGGEVLIQTGNGGDVERDDFPGILGFPDHLLFGGKRSIEIALRKAGMQVITITEFRSPTPTPLNIMKDLLKQIIRENHSPVRWTGPYRSLWIRAKAL